MVKKGDIILSVFCLITAAVMLAGALVFKTDGKKAVITVDGEVFGQYALSEDQTVRLSTERGTNTVTIRDGKVTVTDADCPDRYCADHVAIASVGETIVCLPHRVVIEIKE